MHVNGLPCQSRRLGALLRPPGAPFRHELLEFRFVFCLAKACQKVPEFPLLVLHALDRLGAVLIEGTVGTVTAPPVTAPQPIHLVLEISVTDSSAPDGECKDDKADRPPHYEARIMRRIQAGLPNSSSFATICIALPLIVRLKIYPNARVGV